MCVAEEDGDAICRTDSGSIDGLWIVEHALEQKQRHEFKLITMHGAAIALNYYAFAERPQCARPLAERGRVHCAIACINCHSGRFDNGQTLTIRSIKPTTRSCMSECFRVACFVCYTCTLLRLEP